MTYFGGYFFKVVCVCVRYAVVVVLLLHTNTSVERFCWTYRLCKKKKSVSTTTLKESSLKFKWERQHPNHAAHVVQKQTCTPENVKSVKWRIARNARNHT